jgi:hypothetical protein
VRRHGGNLSSAIRLFILRRRAGKRKSASLALDVWSIPIAVTFGDFDALAQLPARAGDFAAGWTCRSD